MSKARHRGDILEFTIKNSNHLSVSGAIFNMFVRGEDWLSENESSLWIRSGNGAGDSGAKSNTGGIENVVGSSTASATAQDETRTSFSTSADSFHKSHGKGKNVNNNHISISINRFVHRHQQQVIG